MNFEQIGESFSFEGIAGVDGGLLFLGMHLCQGEYRGRKVVMDAYRTPLSRIGVQHYGVTQFSHDPLPPQPRHAKPKERLPVNVAPFGYGELIQMLGAVDIRKADSTRPADLLALSPLN